MEKIWNKKCNPNRYYIYLTWQAKTAIKANPFRPATPANKFSFNGLILKAYQKFTKA
ncbi:hypothetical protein GGTG_11548 [Gaeumannomyces tritici R3-111a-1]|uniref:Uncharacterized protein n=1 Tax=Gaeumannomyces tritici (strain R3-111a-1) TaxID=644352 RepID=J3PDH5_GAET3|nr:hypothetical protein GGTG_11548 [Gaeumannomyces tritici R3-111a-1]EJT70525.1 hypothetical protein GGTG_11548 [Gaeumannomyces tritici R3-111a-1]